MKRLGVIAFILALSHPSMAGNPVTLPLLTSEYVECNGGFARNLTLGIPDGFHVTSSSLSAIVSSRRAADVEVNSWITFSPFEDSTSLTLARYSGNGGGTGVSATEADIGGSVGLTSLISYCQTQAGKLVKKPARVRYIVEVTGFPTLEE